MTQSYFVNIENEISAMISTAESRIFIAVAWFTNSRLFDGLKIAQQRGVKVKVLILDDILNRNEFALDFGALANNGVEVHFSKTDRGSMHNKFCVIDNKVITGSYNWTYHANVNNENIVVIDEPSIANSYCIQFDILFNSSVPITIPYKHLKWTDVTEGDFSELRRNIFREVILNNDENRELKRVKLVKLNEAYKSGNAEELDKASKLSTEKPLKTITDVLTSRSQDYTYKLWEENITDRPYDNVDGYVHIGTWFYNPIEIKEDKNHCEYIEGTIKTISSRNLPAARGLKLNIYDRDFIDSIKYILGTKPLGLRTRSIIPDYMLRIDKAKLFFYKFSSPMFNKSQPRTWRNTMPRTISTINVFGIVKEVDGDNVVFFDGWNPQERGKRIENDLFTLVHFVG